MVPGYKVCSTQLLTAKKNRADTHYRRSLAISPLCNRPKLSEPIPFVYSSIVDTRISDGDSREMLPIPFPNMILSWGLLLFALEQDGNHAQAWQMSDENDFA
jgi:hypothetical protein